MTDAASPASQPMNVAAKEARSLAPTIFCPSVDVDSCVREMRARVAQ
jgi:hypothetical protein